MTESKRKRLATVDEEPTSQNAVTNLLNARMTRRAAIGKAAAAGVGLAVGAVVAGSAGYLLAPQNAATQTVTQTVGPSTTTATSNTSTGTSPYENYADYIALWPIDMRVDNPVTGLTGDVKPVMFLSIPYQSDATLRGSRPSAVQAALKNVYPNVNWVDPYNPGSTGTQVGTVLQSGQYVWDVARGAGIQSPPGPADIPLGHLEPITDYFNAWEDKDQYPSDLMNVFSYNGDVYGVPDTADGHGGWWRQDLFAAAGYGTFDYKTKEYTGTAPKDMDYTELGQAIHKITQQNSANNVYATFIPNSTTAILGPWYLDNMLKANGALRYHGDSTSCTIDLGNAPYYNHALETLDFLQSILPDCTPGGISLDLNGLITNVTTGSLGFFLGLDPNLDGPLRATALNKSNPAAPAGLSVRDALMPTVGFPNGKSLDPNLPPAIKGVTWFGVLKGSPSSNMPANWEWIRSMAGFNAELSLVGNSAGVPNRLDIQNLIKADPKADAAPWISEVYPYTYVDVPINAGYGNILLTAYTNSFDAFFAGSGTSAQCIENFVNSATSGLQKAGIPPAS